MTSAYFRSQSFCLFFFLFSSSFLHFLFFSLLHFPSSPPSNYYYQNTNAARKYATSNVSNRSNSRIRSATSWRRTCLPGLETHSSPPSSPTSRQQHQRQTATFHHYHHQILILRGLIRNPTLQTQTCASKKPTPGNPARHPNPNRTPPPLSDLRLPPPDMSICLL